MLDSVKARGALFHWLEKRLDAPALEWLRVQCARLETGAPENAFHLAFGQVPRKLGKAGHDSLNPSAPEQAQARAAHPGWDLRDWMLNDAARAALLLSLPADAGSARTVLALHQTADLGEHVALVRALFLLPFARHVLHVAREAIRSNMGDVFRAISQRNPYAAEYFDDIAWNQMVAKCVFTDLPLRSIHGLDARANEALARMLLDLARERRAAGRKLSIEAWRCVVPFGGERAGFERGDEVLEFLGAALDQVGKERRGAAVALAAFPGAQAAALLKSKAPELLALLETGTLTWETYHA